MAELCAGENQYFDASAFRKIGTTWIHPAGDWHRVSDGTHIEMNGDDPVLDTEGNPVVVFAEPEPPAEMEPPE